MEFLNFIDLRTVFITLAVVIVLWNAISMIRYMAIKRKADKELKEIDAKIAAVNKQLEETKKAVLDNIKKQAQ